MSQKYRHSDGSWADFPESPVAHSKMEELIKNSSISYNVKENDKQELGSKDAIGDPTKPRLSLIPIEALWALGGALTYGEKHYGTHNWRKGIKISILLDAALRHINEFNAGEDIDQKSQNHHLGNAMANLAMAISTLKNNPAMDDRWSKK